MLQGQASSDLVETHSRDLYNNLVKSLPTIKPPNWTRSRIRRQHLISLGVPVNLDEVMPHANGRPLPPLQISTRPMSAPPGPRQVHAELGSTTRPGTPQLGNRQGPSFGPKPELDESKIMQLLSLNPGYYFPVTFVPTQLTSIQQIICLSSLFRS